LGRAGGKKLDATLDSAIKAGQAAKKLKAMTAGTDKRGESGYTQGSREDMNRLIQNRTDN